MTHKSNALSFSSAQGTTLVPAYEGQPSSPTAPGERGPDFPIVSFFSVDHFLAFFFFLAYCWLMKRETSSPPRQCSKREI